MATKKEYKEKLNMAGGVPEKVDYNRELIEMLTAQILELEKRIEKLEQRSLPTAD